MTLLQVVEAAVARDPGLLLLSVVRKALKGLNQGESAMVVVEWLSADLDKIHYGESREFGEYLMQAHKCTEAYRRIHAINQGANDGRGSEVVRHMLAALERFDLDDARSTFKNNGDKIRQYPELYSAIERTVIGCRDHGITYFCPHCHNPRK